MKSFFSAVLRLSACVAFLGTACLGIASAEEPIPGLPHNSVPKCGPDSPFHSESALNRFLDACGYEVGFFATHLEQGRSIERHADRQVCLASMAKVFCLTELFRRAEDGLDLDSTMLDVPGLGTVSLREAAGVVVSASDHSATQALAAFLGRDRVNALPEALGLDGFSANVIPDEQQLHEMLDQRLAGNRKADPALPMHGTARAMARFYEMLYAHQVTSPQVSRNLLTFFEQHDEPFSHTFRRSHDFGGQGGSVLWTRLPQHYSAMGWGLLLTSPHGQPARAQAARSNPRQQGSVALCVWGEWFPEEMSAEEQQDFLAKVTDSLLAILFAPQRATKRIENNLILQL